MNLKSDRQLFLITSRQQRDMDRISFNFSIVLRSNENTTVNIPFYNSLYNGIIFEKNRARLLVYLVNELMFYSPMFEMWIRMIVWKKINCQLKVFTICYRFEKILQIFVNATCKMAKMNKLL